MTRQALRLRVGDATTGDFIADAEKISGQDLRAFFSTWLYAPAAPPMPPLLPTQ
jgi:aminopeptidase N